MRIDHTAFFNGYRQAFGSLKQGQVTGIENDPEQDLRPAIAYGILRAAIVK